MFLPSRISNSTSASPASVAKVIGDYQVSLTEISGKSGLLNSSVPQYFDYATALKLVNIPVSSVNKKTAFAKPEIWECVHTLTRNSQAVAFSPDGRMLATGSTFIKLFDLETGLQIRTLRRDSGILKALAFSPDGKTLISSGLSQRIELWNVFTGKLISEFVTHAYAVNALAFGKDGKSFVSGDRGKTIQFWNADDTHATATFVQHHDWVNSLAISHNGAIAASGSYDETIKLWNLHTKTEIATINAHSPVFSVAFSPDEKLFICGWNWQTAEFMGVIVGHADEVNSVAVNREGTIIASASADKTVRLWNSQTGEEIATLTGHTSNVKYLTFSPDGNMLASASAEGNVKVWRRG
jgi:WD40 repeat protein